MSQGPLPGQIIPAITGTAVSTDPGNGDGNPYGVGFVPAGFPGGGALHPGDLLVDNFNSNSGFQGTGTTIVRVDANQHVSTFFNGKKGLGLTTALGFLSRGYVVVGNFPSTDGTTATSTPGSLLILDKNGKKVFTISGSYVDGPWDMTIDDKGATADLYVSNALSGTVVRIELSVPKSGSGFVVTDHDTIASGYVHHGDPVGFVQGPTGLVYEKSTDTLLVASTGDNKVYAVSDAGTRETSGGKGSVFYQDNAHLRGPLGMIEAPNGDFIVANSDLDNADATQTSEYVEFNSKGFIGQYSVDASPGGAFGLAVKTVGEISTFAAVDDNVNTINFWNVESPGGDPTDGVPFTGENGQIIPQITGVTFNTNSPAGDTNPYGVAFVPANIAPGGFLHPGNILVSNFNSGSGLQGTGNTVMRINSAGQVSTFYKGHGLGLTTALDVLRRGYVVVGNLPSTDGSAATAKAGSLLILNDQGQLVFTLTSKKYIDGPWDMTVVDHGATATLFVSNVLSGTISRIILSVPTSGVGFHVLSETQIASGYAHRADSAAFVVGPTGLAYDPRATTSSSPPPTTTPSTSFRLPRIRPLTTAKARSSTRTTPTCAARSAWCCSPTGT